MSTPRISVTSRTGYFISLIILSDSEDVDTTLPIVSAPSSLNRIPASSGYSSDSHSDSEPTKDDSSDEDMMETTESPPDSDCFDIICSATIHPLPSPPLPPLTSSLPSDMLPPHKEGAPSTFEKEESSIAHVLLVTSESVDHTIPLLASRLIRHEALIDKDALERARHKIIEHQIRHEDSKTRLQQCEDDMLELRAHIRRLEDCFGI
ncbi:hypothetical protein Tco_1179289 [Tanacetum coccineum]